jgi:hypothetical protein
MLLLILKHDDGLTCHENVDENIEKLFTEGQISSKIL